MSYIQMIIVVLLGLMLGSVFTSLSIPLLQRLKTGQSIREEGPESHLKKSGTPTMGGIAIVAAVLMVSVTTREFSLDLLLILGAFLLFGGLGFLDDYLKVVRRHNLGLRAWQKLAGQLILAGGIALYKVFETEGAGQVLIPFLNERVDLGILAIPFLIFVVTAMTNGVNLTDGLDGLASGVTALVALFFAIASVPLGFGAPGVFFSALAGACLGFLFFNRHPARVFMGDTGSLALGGGIAAASILMEMELFLLIVGLVYVVETLSVILQVASYKLRGKRIFKMAPLHHHFELSGMKEQHVVGMFVLVTLILSVIGLGIV
jgi:phospho-N-acetylmuramoyl-pentapeptide-transferase